MIKLIKQPQLTKPNGYLCLDRHPLSANPGKQGMAKMKCYLGTAKSPKYKCAMIAIARRNQIQLLTKQIKQLEALALKARSPMLQQS